MIHLCHEILTLWGMQSSASATSKLPNCFHDKGCFSGPPTRSSPEYRSPPSWISRSQPHPHHCPTDTLKWDSVPKLESLDSLLIPRRVCIEDSMHRHSFTARSVVSRCRSPKANNTKKAMRATSRPPRGVRVSKSLNCSS
jgi:hypothetical protein